MPDMSPTIPEGRQIVEAYGDGGFRVSGRRYEGSAIIGLELVTPWPVTNLAAAEFSQFEALFRQDPVPELLLFGCGQTVQPVPAGLRQQLLEKGVRIELMDTGAAARTYTILAAEGRFVAAALIAID